MKQKIYIACDADAPKLETVQQLDLFTDYWNAAACLSWRPMSWRAGTASSAGRRDMGAMTEEYKEKKQKLNWMLPETK